MLRVLFIICVFMLPPLILMRHDKELGTGFVMSPAPGIRMIILPSPLDPDVDLPNMREW